MEEGLVEFEALLREASPEFLERFRPGLSNFGIKAFEAALAIELPESLRSLYTWRDGESEEGWGGPMIFWPGTLMDSYQVVRTATQLQAAWTSVENGHLWWDPSWVPIVADPCGGYLCVDMGGCYDGQAGQVLTYEGSNDRFVYHKSLEHWLDSYLQGLRRGVFTLDLEKGLHVTKAHAIDLEDDLGSAEACARLWAECSALADLNPGLPRRVQLEY